MTSGRPASYSSKTSAVGRCRAQGREAFAEFGDLLAVFQDDGVLADQVDTADVAVQVDADTGPVQARRNLFDMGRFTGAVITLDHDPAVVGEAGENGQRRVVIETIGIVSVGHVGVGLAEGGDLHVTVNPEGLTRRYRDIRARCGHFRSAEGRC